MAAGFQVSSSSSAARTTTKNNNSTILLLLLLLVTTSTYCQQVSASRSMPPAAANAPTPTTESADQGNKVRSTGDDEDHDQGITYLVGDVAGWIVIPGCGLFDFQRWADLKTFYPGDTLEFWFSNNSVLQVNREDYESCNLSSPLVVYPSDEDYVEKDIYVKLEREGDYYFVSGSHNYCDIAVQKVHVKVLPRPLSPRSSAAPAPASSAPAPASYADRPRISGATSISPTQSRMSWMVFGLSLMVVILYV